MKNTVTVDTSVAEFHTSQAHVADLAAMVDDGNAEHLITPAAPAPTAHATPLPDDWHLRSRRAKKQWWKRYGQD